VLVVLLDELDKVCAMVVMAGGAAATVYPVSGSAPLK
jgi:hypothetical protein